MAVNRGVVRIAANYRNYGKSIFIDHGLELVSYYLHLSKYKVKVGDVVERGQVIGLSGHTGYTLGAHLHLGIKINEITIDPVNFFELFK
jgi:murein DD-endopeptidase MepM/ murein hydrolase activator NlpD